MSFPDEHLAHDGELFKLRPWRSHFDRGFHPGGTPTDLGDRWLREHETHFDVVDRN